MSFDLDQFRLPEKTHPATTTRIKSAGKSAPRKQKTLFIKGPISLPWLRKVHLLPGITALPLGLLLWFQAGLERRKYDLKLTPKLRGHFGLKDRAVYDAIIVLEAAGLISVQRSPGRCLRVTILDEANDES
jgi:hypothetical protein